MGKHSAASLGGFTLGNGSSQLCRTTNWKHQGLHWLLRSLLIAAASDVAVTWIVCSAETASNTIERISLLSGSEIEVSLASRGPHPPKTTKHNNAKVTTGKQIADRVHLLCRLRSEFNIVNISQSGLGNLKCIRKNGPLQVESSKLKTEKHRWPLLYRSGGFKFS